MKLTEKQTDNLIEEAQKKRLGQKKSTTNISFKELPLTYLEENTKKILRWISTKAQTNLDQILYPKATHEAPYKIQTYTKVQKYLEQNTLTVSTRTQNRITNEIQEILAKSETEGIGNREVGHLIQERFQKLRTYEAERIARTEINSANNLTAYQRYLDDPLVDYNQWAATSDNRTRDTHKKINGEITRVGHKFSNGLQHPGDKNGSLKEFINCRCTIVPWFPDFDKMPPTGMAQFKEKDCIPLPPEQSGQVTLQLDEDQKLYEVRQGALKVNIEQLLGINPQNKETTLDTYLKQPKEYIQTTLDKILNRNNPMSIAIENKRQQLRNMGLTDKAINKIKIFQNKHCKETIEHGALYSREGEELYYKSGTFGEIELNFVNITEKDDAFSIHNHPIIENLLQVGKGYAAPSGQDIKNMLTTIKEKYCVVINEKEIWVVKSPNKTYSDNEAEEVSEKIEEILRKYDKLLNQELDDYENFLQNNSQIQENLKNYYKSRNFKNIDLQVKLKIDLVKRLKNELLKSKYRFMPSKEIRNVLLDEGLDISYITI